VTTSDLAAAPAFRVCPRCAAPLVSDTRAEPWCERCEWGLDHYDPPAGAGWTSRWLGRLSHRVAYRATTSQFRGLEQSPLTRPGFGMVRLALIGISLVLMTLTLALAAGGVWLILLNPNFATIVVGGAAILVAIALVPPLGRFNRDYTPLTRDSAPTLYALVDRLAGAVGTRAPHVIAVSSDYNAAVSAYGLRPRRVLYLGLAMWGVLTPQQRVALLGHELGHFVNGDVRKGLLARPAMITLGRLARLLGPERRRRRSNFLVALAESLMRVIMQPIVVGLMLAQLGILALAFRDGQRAEYLADVGAARLAGASAAVELTDLLVQGEGGHTVVASQARAGGGVDEWRTAIAEMRERQTPGRLHRLRQLTVRCDSSLLATHPPSGLRSRLLESAAWPDPSFVLTADESARIDAELAAYYKRFRRDIAHTQV
jgi:Zn-dependent protease with chaperone function